MSRSVSKRLKADAPTARKLLLNELIRTGRKYGDATVLFHNQMAAHIGLDPTDYKTMSYLARVEHATASEIGRHTGLSSASVTELLDRLERKGFIRLLPIY